MAIGYAALLFLCCSTGRLFPACFGCPTKLPIISGFSVWVISHWRFLALFRFLKPLLTHRLL